MTTFLNMSPENGHSSTIEVSSDIKLPLHVQCDLPAPLFDHHAKPKAINIPNPESDNSTTCTNPRLREMLETYFPSDDDNWDTDVEYDGSPCVDPRLKKGRRRRRTTLSNTAKVKHCDQSDDESLVTSWPIYPIQCCVQSRESFNIPSDYGSSNSDQTPSRFIEARKKNSVREERCRQAIYKISAALKVDQLETCTPSTADESWDEKIIPDLVGEQECSTMDGDNGFISQDDESSCRSELIADMQLTERAKKIQHGLNLQELEELAWEAERAAEAGDEKFFGSATKFGIDEVAASSIPSFGIHTDVAHVHEDAMDAFTTPNKSNCGRRHRLDSSRSNSCGTRIITPPLYSISRTNDCRDELDGITTISPPPRLKRFPKTAVKRPKNLKHLGRNMSAPCKIQHQPSHEITPSHLSNTLNMTATFLSSRQFATALPPPKKIRVMSLRHVDEVIPSFMEMHHNLRLNLVRNGVGAGMLLHQSDDYDIDKLKSLAGDKKENFALAQVASFPFFPRVDSFQRMFSSDNSLGTREGDNIDSPNSLVYNESFAMSPDQIIDDTIDDTIDCVSFVSCGSATLNTISRQVLMTPKKPLHANNVVDHDGLHEDMYVCTLASEIHIPGRENVWTVSPLPSVPHDVDAHYETNDCFATPPRAHNVRPSSKSRWSSFWENLSPKRKLFAPSPLRLPRIMSSSRTLATSSASGRVDPGLELPPPDLESLQSELESQIPELEPPLIQCNIDERQDLHDHDKKQNVSSVEVNNIASSLISPEELDDRMIMLDSPLIRCNNDESQGVHDRDKKQNVFSAEINNIASSFVNPEELDHSMNMLDYRTKPPDSIATVNTTCDYEQAKQSFINTSDSTMSMITSSNYERAKQSFNGTNQHADITDSCKQKLSFENSDILSEQTFPPERSEGFQIKPVKQSYNGTYQHPANMDSYKQKLSSDGSDSMYTTKKSDTLAEQAFSFESFYTAKQSIVETYQKTANTDYHKEKLSFEDNNSMCSAMKKSDVLLDQICSTKNSRDLESDIQPGYFLSLLSSSDSTNECEYDILSDTRPSTDDTLLVSNCVMPENIGTHVLNNTRLSEDTLLVSNCGVSENIRTRDSKRNFDSQKEDGDESPSTEVQIVGPNLAMNVPHNRFVFPLEQVSFPSLYRKIPGMNIESDKPPLYPAVTRLANILKRVNQRLSVEETKFSKPLSNEVTHSNNSVMLQIDQQATSEPSSIHQNEAVAIDGTSRKDNSSEIIIEVVHVMRSQNEDPVENIKVGLSESTSKSNTIGPVINVNFSSDHTLTEEEQSELPEGKNDSIKKQLSNLTDGPSVFLEQPNEGCHKKQSSLSSLPSRICFGDDSSLCGIGDGGTEGICDGRANYLLDHSCDEKSTLVGMIENVPSIIGRLSPLLGRKIPNGDNKNTPEDISFLKNYFYVGVESKNEPSTQLHTSDDTNSFINRDVYCGTYEWGLGCNMDAALECLPENNSEILDTNNNVYPTNSNQVLRRADTKKKWSNKPLFQRGKVTLGDRAFESPALQLKKGGVFNQQKKEDLDDLKGDMDNTNHSIAFAELEIDSQDTSAENDVEMENPNLLWHVRDRVSRSAFSPIQENCENVYHVSSNKVEVMASKDEGLK